MSVGHSAWRVRQDVPDSLIREIQGAPRRRGHEEWESGRRRRGKSLGGLLGDLEDSSRRTRGRVAVEREYLQAKASLELQRGRETMRVRVHDRSMTP